MGLLWIALGLAGAQGGAGLSPGQVPTELGLSAADASSFSGTAGFIRTRPTCAPPGYTPDALNYLQGPEPIARRNGDVTLVVGAGRCCVGHWEGLYSLNYPAADRASTPRFHPLWATNDFSRAPQRKEAEVGFPSALFYGGKWRVAFTTTFRPFHRPDRDRVARLDLADLEQRATPAQVKNAWVLPIALKCRQIAGCPGEGSGTDPVLTLHPNGDLYVYHSDGNYPACTSGYLRHRVAPDFTIDNSGDDGCVEFEGLEQAPFLISDIARTAAGDLLLLSSATAGPSTIVEWTSSGDAAEIGLHWQPTGRRWPAPVHPAGAEWHYYVRDAAYLKDETRTVVEPGVVVAQISDGRTYGEMADVQLGRWYLYYWADDGATLPPGFGGPASSCGMQGKLESASCTEVRGWAWDPMFPASPTSVDVWVDGKYAATVAADRYRPDLQRGDGRHGFAWPVPAALRNRGAHWFTARYTDTGDVVAGKVPAINCR